MGVAKESGWGRMEGVKDPYENSGTVTACMCQW